jgi:hypothetical protein
MRNAELGTVMNVTGTQKAVSLEATAFHFAILHVPNLVNNLYQYYYDITYYLFLTFHDTFAISQYYENADPFI